MSFQPLWSLGYFCLMNLTHTWTHTHTHLVTVSWVSAAWSCNPKSNLVEIHFKIMCQFQQASHSSNWKMCTQQAIDLDNPHLTYAQIVLPLFRKQDCWEEADDRLMDCKWLANETSNIIFKVKDITSVTSFVLKESEGCSNVCWVISTPHTELHSQMSEACVYECEMPKTSMLGIAQQKMKYHKIQPCEDCLCRSLRQKPMSEACVYEYEMPNTSIAWR